jgi:hypothetical protein
VLDGQLIVMANREATRKVQDELAILRTAGSITAGENKASPMDVLETEDGDGFGDAWCPGGESKSKQTTALMLLGVGTGMVEHFGHFVWDYLLNLHRLLVASGTQPGQDGCCQVILHAGSIRSLYEQRPRKYFELVAAVTGGSSQSFWQTLQEIEDGTCLQNVILGFGTPRLPKSSAVPHRAHPLSLMDKFSESMRHTLRVCSTDTAHRVQRIEYVTSRLVVFPTAHVSDAAANGSEAVLRSQVR